MLDLLGVVIVTVDAEGVGFKGVRSVVAVVALAGIVLLTYGDNWEVEVLGLFAGVVVGVWVAALESG